MRLFVAIGLPAALKREIGEQLAAIKSRFPPTRWMSLEQLHLTLLFIGDLGEELLPRMDEHLKAVFAAHAPIRLRLSRPGIFPPRRPARVAWIGLDASPDLSPLHGELRHIAASIAPIARQSRAFHPHLTLARCRRPWSPEEVDIWCGAFSQMEGSGCVARHGTLFSSTLGPGGARHESIGAYPLGAAA